MSGPTSTPIRAAVTRGVGRPTSVETLHLASPGPDEVRVALSACAVCHSDLMYIDGGWATGFPLVLGHEAAGRIVETGPGVDDLAAGTKVVVSLIRSCGTCRACRRGHHVTCSGSFRLADHSPLTDGDGRPVAQGLNTGAFAEQVVVHRSQVVPLPDGVPARTAALLGCGVLTGAGAARNSSPVGPDDTVVVIGCGGVGLGTVQAARLAGADAIVAVDPVADKRSAALDVGATHAADPTTDDVAAAIQTATGGRLADQVFITTAAGAALDDAVDLLAPMGALVLVGMPADGVTTEFDPSLLAAANQRIVGSKMGTTRLDVDVPELLDHYLAGRLELDAMVSSTHPLDDIDAAFDEVRRGQVVRTVIVFDPDEEATP